MIIDVIWLGDAHARREARAMPPVGRIVELTRNMTTERIIAVIVLAAGRAPISQLRFHGVDPHLIFNTSTVALFRPNTGGRTTTPEEDALMSLNPHFASGRAIVMFFPSYRNRHSDRDGHRSFNRFSDLIRDKAWPNAASVEFYSPN